MVIVETYPQELQFVTGPPPLRPGEAEVKALEIAKQVESMAHRLEGAGPKKFFSRHCVPDFMQMSMMPLPFASFALPKIFARPPKSAKEFM